MYFVCILTYAINNIIPVVFKKLFKKKKEEIKKKNIQEAFKWFRM